MRNIFLFLLSRLREREEHVHSDEILTVPNVITGIGFLGVGVYLWLLFESALWTLPLIHVGVLLTDALDGIAADLLKQHSKFGRAFDPVRDRFHAGAVILTIALLGADPVVIAALLCAGTAESLIMLLGISGRIGKPTSLGKARAVIYGIAGFGTLVELCWAGEFFGLRTYVVIMATASVLAAIQYFAARKPRK